MLNVACVQMIVRLLSSTEDPNVMLLYLMACVLVYSACGCMLTWTSLIVPKTKGEVALLLGQAIFGYGNQA